jgi:3-methyladenine DNA glycosylase AlkD
MDYLITNPLLEAQIKSIQTTLRLSMNGIVSDSMKQKGIHYKLNYGVSIPRLKEIAATYEPNHDLARRLWHLHSRETMILACFLQPVETYSKNTALHWVSKFNQIEIVEIACMSLFSKLSFADQLSIELVSSNNDWEKITGFILSARIAEGLDIAFSEKILTKSLKNSSSNNFHLYKAIALALSRISRKNECFEKKIMTNIETFSFSKHQSENYIYNEVKNEISFHEL